MLADLEVSGRHLVWSPDQTGQLHGTTPRLGPIARGCHIRHHRLATGFVPWGLNACGF